MKRFRWKIYCETDSKWEFNWRDSGEQTVCPVDGGHTVRTGSGAIIKPQFEKKPKQNVGTVVPGSTDDVDAGYSLCSRWLNTATNKEYVCVDNARAAAVWTETTQGAGFFGNELHDVESEALSTTTSTTFQQKLRMTTASLPLGKYILIYSMEYAVDTADAEVQLEQNDTTQLGVNQTDGSLDDKFLTFGDHKILDAISGIHTFDLDFKAMTGAPTVSVQRARLTLWRLS